MTAIGVKTPAIETHGLRKSFSSAGKKVEAVRGVDLFVRSGEIFGFLGPNGAGKTTTLRMLATLMPIDAGEASVAGADVRWNPRQVRQRIGYVPQIGGADLPATGRENLLLQARLYGATAAEAHQRAGEAIELLALGDFADRPARTYSGGQRRRLEVALGIMHRPAVLFLDEPTIGLDPQNRANLWDQLRALRAAGTTIFLTTHYLDEADALADRVAIIDHGAIVAEGTPLELKSETAGATLVVRVVLDDGRLEDLRLALAGLDRITAVSIDGEALRMTATDGVAALSDVAELLAARGVPVRSAALSEASLDDVFLARTGRSLRDTAAQEAMEAAR